MLNITRGGYRALWATVKILENIKSLFVYLIYILSVPGHCVKIKTGEQGPKQNTTPALARWFCWLEHSPAHQKVVGWISSQGTYLGCRFNPQKGCEQEATDQCFSLTSMSLSPWLSL